MVNKDEYKIPDRGQQLRRRIVVCSIFKSSTAGVHQCFSAPTRTWGTQEL